MFKKIFAVVAACATVATMSVSAFAADPTASHEAGSVSVDGYAAVSDATQYTVMVFENSFEEDYDVNKIYYINQGSDPDALLTGMLVKGGDLTEGDYTVRIGNDAGDAIDVEFSVEAVATGYKITGYVADTYATVTIGETTVEVAEDGSFTFADFANGAYSLIVKAPGALNRTVAVTVADADVALTADDTALVYGATSENAEQIGLSDLLDIQANYKKTTTDDGYSLNLDFDRDGVVGLSDLLEVQANYKKTIAEAYGN